jgi:5-oxoprolinase (ATP-hydrolysing)
MWRVHVDTGGTFTDAVGIDPEGRLHRAKILSTGALRGHIESRDGPRRFIVGGFPNPPERFFEGFEFRLLEIVHPARQVVRHDAARSLIEISGPLEAPAHPGTAFELLSTEEAPVLAARLLTRTPSGRPLPIEEMRLATTLGTNALLERRGDRTALFITAGFGDLLAIGTQQRPDLFALEVRKRLPLYEEVVEVPERLAADGSVLSPLLENQVAEVARRLAAGGVRTAAVALLHSYRNRDHEERVRAILLRAGFHHVSCSNDLAPFIRLLPRAETAVVDAYLAPLVAGYLHRVSAALEGRRVHVMTSAGGLVAASAFRPKDSLLSGPAGGVVGAAAAGRRAGCERLITFDMGGTSTDVARIDGDYEYSYEHEVGDAHLVAPALAIESVAAGGGSVCWFDGHRLRVGPQSAGATPGPACYGAGGPLTLTDVNLLLGRLRADRFGIPVSAGRAQREFAALCATLWEKTGTRSEPEALLEGFLEIADERMADAIRQVSLRRGYDPADYALVAFGGAGGQHACAVADRLGITTVLIPPDAGLLSALGLGQAVLERFAEEQVLRPLAEVEGEVPGRLKTLARRAAEEVRAAGVPPDRIAVRRRLAHLRFVGQDATVEVPCDAGVPLLQAFEARYADLYGHRPERRAVELESLRVVASELPPASEAARASFTSARTAAGPAAVPSATPPVSAVESSQRARLGGAWKEVAAVERDGLAPGAIIHGPALVFEPHAATVVDEGWRGEVDGAGTLRLVRATPPETLDHGAQPEAVRLELFTNRFRAIAREMGERLRRTAVSTNIKERLDFSCALLDASGELVVNAPHIPVHLGALGLCVRMLMKTMPLDRGDVLVTNHPAFGGSHLPDVTVVTPVFGEGSGAEALLGYVASRAHHAEIGGARPGSMPPAARRLAEEGVVIPPTYVERGGVARWDEIRDLLRGGPFPSRAVDDNLADLRAAAAANHAGALALQALARAHGPGTVRRYMESLKELAATRLGDALAGLPDGRYEAKERLDDGSPLRVTITKEGRHCGVDFTGSAAVHPGNLNATPAIVRSALIYVLRLLLRQPLPLNEGLLHPVTLTIPEGMLNPPFPDDPWKAPAVVGGNVETSQRLVDTLLKALGLAACSQGTMNNVLFGTEAFGYYETICGGCGATPNSDGASAVHSHMTNTRITDPELIEHRYPVRVERFAVRRGSGGAGRYRGGEGAVREFTFLAPMELSVLSQHRTVPPYGLEGGGPGRIGAQWVVRAGGAVQELRPIDGCAVEAGDRFIIETPGGGGYGTP